MYLYKIEYKNLNCPMQYCFFYASVSVISIRDGQDALSSPYKLQKTHRRRAKPVLFPFKKRRQKMKKQRRQNSGGRFPRLRSRSFSRRSFRRAQTEIPEARTIRKSRKAYLSRRRNLPKTTSRTPTSRERKMNVIRNHVR